MATANEPIINVDITGVKDSTAVLKFDVSLGGTDGSISYNELPVVGQSSINGDVTIQGVKGMVSKVGTIRTSSTNANTTSIEIGSALGYKNLTLLYSENETTFAPYNITDIVSKIAAKSGANIKYKGYDLCVESYQFDGKLKDCLHDLANLVYGSVVYDSAKDEYTIMAGNYTTTNSKATAIADNLLIEYELSTEKDRSYQGFAMILLNTAKEIAKLRQSILDAKDTNVSVTSTKVLADQINFRFGTAGGFTPIPKDIIVESLDWDEWYEDEAGNKYVNKLKADTEAADPKFVPKQEKYYKEEVLSQTIVKSGTNSSSGYSVTRGKKRGLRSISNAKLLYRLKNIDSITGIKGKGSLTNISTLGMPSIDELTALKNTMITDSVKYDDGYHTLYEVEVLPVNVATGEGKNYVVEYIPHISFTVNSFIRNAVTDYLKVKLARSPSSVEIDSTMLAQLYEVNMEIMSENDTNSLLYKGYIDKHGRVIDLNNKVILVAGTDNISYYAPIEGMDINFNNALSQPSTTVTDQNPIIFSQYFDSQVIAQDIESAYTDLRTKATINPDLIVAKAMSSDYPQYLYELVKPTGGSGGVTLGRVIGIVLGKRESTEDLSIGLFTIKNKQIKRLERKLKTLECRINLVVKCMNKKTTVVDLATIKSKLKEIINYYSLIYEVKDENLTSVAAKKSNLDASLNYFLDTLASSESAVVSRIKAKIILPSTIPLIGSNIQILGSTYKVLSATGSGLELSIEGEAA